MVGPLIRADIFIIHLLHPTMTHHCEHKNPLQRDGSSRLTRRIAALDPAFVQPDDRSPEDLVHYAAQLAQELNFYDLKGEVAGNWSNFLAAVENVSESDWGKSAAHEPHLALFLAFLKLFRHSQEHLNEIPRKHLDFFFTRILRLPIKPPQSDRVHLLFELNKRIDEQRVPQGSRFLAGKDNKGIPLFYRTEKDILINRAKAVHFRSVFRAADGLRSALFAHTRDGWGEAFEEPDTAWPAFGHESLPKADTGIAFSAHILLLSEGRRTVTLTFRLSGHSPHLEKWDEQVFLRNLYIVAGGEKNWIGPFMEVTRSNAAEPVLQKMENGFQLKFSFVIPASEPAVVPYQESVLKERLPTTDPVVKIRMRSDAGKFLEGMILDGMQIQIAVERMQNLVLENDFGTLDTARPFQPFGPQPKERSSLYIGSEEVFTKKLSNLQLHIKWRGLPNDFSSIYRHYPKLGKNTSFTATFSVMDEGGWGPESRSVNLFPTGLSQTSGDWTIPDQGAIAGQFAAVAKPVAFVLQNWRPVLYAKQAHPERVVAPASLLAQAPFFVKKMPAREWKRRFFNASLKEGFIRLTLNKDFGHSEYIDRTAEVASNNANPQRKEWLTPPHRPYTPEMQYLKLSYTAQTGVESFMESNGNEQKYLRREIQFFHLTPFGHSEEHPHIKKQLPFLTSSKVHFLPDFSNKGEFYIGLEEAEPLRNVSLLFQLAEGSANPDAPAEKVQWSVLCKNHWKPVSPEEMPADHTNNLLQSGIIEFSIPREASIDNTLLDKGFIWLRAALKHRIDAVCRVTGIHAQAVSAVWDDSNRAERHLENALPAGTIKKMELEAGAIKKITQPYASFGGRPGEQSSAYDQRVAERLRHKNRASGIWDFEHMVLEQFPQVHKVKCLNHTSPAGELSAGHITLVLIPDLRNANAVDVLQPRFSAAILREVEAYMRRHCSKFVKIYAQNPEYEEIEINAKVKFKGGDKGFSARQLNQELIRFLTPWAFDTHSDIHFDAGVHLSRIIAFAEQLPYVDYLEHFSMRQKTEGGILTNASQAFPSNSRAILVSAKKHNIEII